jgi:hypothetical protein
MRISLKAKVPSLSRLAAELKDAILRATHETARKMPERITDHLKAGRKPDGSPQPRNADSTREAKRRAGQSATPGVADGLMSDPSRWRVELDADGAGVGVPLERRDVPRMLRDLEYEFFGIPPESERDLEEALDRELGRL